MKQIHIIQLQILKKLLYSTGLRYSQIKPSVDMENNQFDFHLNKLISEGHIEKNIERYQLTPDGKDFANRIDADSTMMQKQAKIGTYFACTRKKDDTTQFLIYTRLKQPFYGCQGFPSGKVQYGEMITGTAKRELKEETNLDGIPQVILIKHFLVHDKKSGQLVEDKFMFLCLVTEPTGELIPSDEGKYEWVNEEDLKTYVTNHFENFNEFMNEVKILKNFDGTITFTEINQFSEKF
jgi:ADP-ribose pyrophosphatase YjhB (NUDIX family)/predicted transcriptional regulator